MDKRREIKLSVVVPAFNEERTLGGLLNKIQSVKFNDACVLLEIIVVDDCSKDKTAEIARSFSGVTLLRNEKNQGKGRSVRRGVEVSTGQVILVQDADLEYNPDDYPKLLNEWFLLADQYGEDRAVVYGSRFLGQWKKNGFSVLPPGRHPQQGIGPWGANLLLSLLTFILTLRWFTDLLTAYKLYPGPLLRSIRIETHGFETDHELTMRLFRKGCRFSEIPIDYFPRSKAEGKKIRAIDFVYAVETLVKYRLSPK